MKKIILLLAVIFLGYDISASEPKYIEGQYIITLKESVSDSNFSSLFQIPAPNIERLSDDTFLIYSDEDLSALQLTLLEDDLIEAIEKDQVVHVVGEEDQPLSNDPMLSKLWGLENKEYSGIDIGVKEVWKKNITGSKDVVVAVIDTGIDYTHPDLKDNMWVNEGEIPENEIDDDGNGYVDDVHGWDFVNKKVNGLDDHSHGTHCAGTIGAKGNNEIGVVGVNWDVSLMAVKFISRFGRGDLSNGIKSIDYAVKMGANVLSNSWGGASYSRALEKAIEKARKKEILFIAAAGNNNSNSDRKSLYPANYNLDNVISVGAMTSQGKRASFSNSGKRTVHVFAPGHKVVSTVLKGKYKSFSGTSMATPHVAGAAALLLSNQPNLNYKEIKKRLIWSSDHNPKLKNLSISNGLINLSRALKNDLNPIDPNDSRFWLQMKEVSISRPKEFKAKTPVNFFIKAPEGAIRLAVQFSKLNLAVKDKIKIFALTSEKDQVGSLVETIVGGKADRVFISDGDKAQSLRIEYTPFKNSDEEPKAKVYDFHIDRLVYSVQ